LALRGIHVEVIQEPMLLLGDRPRLVEVFQNLIDNAAKFMGGQKNPRIEIGVKADGQDWIILVRDNGMGIDPRHQSRLFGLFEKLDAQAEGTGMGLALVKRIVENHGGRIWMESQGLNQGATFYFTLANVRKINETEMALWKTKAH
jgi:signal transduction histidine kinase